MNRSRRSHPISSRAFVVALVASLLQTVAGNALANGRPTATVTLTPAAPHRHQTVSAYVTTNDPEGDPMTLKYLWRVNGGVYRITESTGSTVERVFLPDVHAIEGESVSVEVTPRDAGGTGATVSAGTSLVNAPPLAGGAASALELDGTDDYVRLPDNLFPYPPASPANSAFSFEVTFKTTGGGVILGQQATEPFMFPSDGWVPAVYVGTNGKLHVTMFQHWLQPVQSPLPVNDGNWHHVAVTFDGSSETVYLDGLVLESRAASQGGYTSTYRYQLGVGHTMYWPNDNGGWYHFNGQLDEVRVWNRARTAGEIVGWMNGPLVEADPALLAYYKFDEGGGSVANDSSGAGRHGALINGPVWRTTGTKGVGIPSNVAIAVTEDADYSGTLPGSDNGYQQTVTFSAVRQPTNGVLYLQANGQFIYSSKPNYRGPDSFTYRTHDGTTFGNTSLVSVNVASVNDAPRFDQLLNVIMGVNVPRTLQITGIDSGAPNEQQTLSITATSDNTTVVPHPSVSYTSPSTTGSLTFTPTALGTANITVTLNDGGPENATFTRTFQVTVQSDVPSLEVTTLQDSTVGGDGQVSLREAIAYAATLSGSPIVTFAPGVTGTITLGAQLTVNHNMTIAGPGAKLLAIDGNAASRIFNVTAGNTVTIQDLTIRNGKALGSDSSNTHGGGIYNAGALSLFRCAITGNRAEGFSTGGGIFNSGTLTMVGCTVANNWSSDAGGGLRHNAGTANLTNCTFAHNEGASGGGIQVVAGTANVRHCTIGYNNSRETGTGRAGGIQVASGATLNFNNSITSGNTRAGVLGGDFNSFSASSTANAIGTNARLGALRDNGGPTQTIAPLSGSNAIDSAIADGTSTDQRGEGFTRSYDHASVANRNGSSGSDIGAYEVQRGELASANDQDVVALMAVAKAITLVGSVDDNSTPTFSIVSQPAHGTLSAISGDQLTYTSHGGYTGADSFTFRAQTSGGAASNVATVRINVSPSNRAPVAIGTGVQDNFNDNSLDGAKWQTYYPLAGSLVTEENGAISLKRRGYLNTAAQFKPSAANPLRITGRFTFGPTNDSFQVLTRSNGANANNSAGTTGETANGIEFGAFQSGGYIAILQRSNSVATTLASAAMTLNVNQTYTFEINDNGSAVSMTVANAANPSITSTVNAANAASFGTNRVTFHNSDGVNIVLQLDDIVISTTGVFAALEDTTSTGYVVATDIDGDALTYTKVDGPAHGSLTLNAAGAFTYRPDAEYSGPDSFRFKANDGALDSNIATVSINVIATNDPPDASGQSVATIQNASRTITLAGTDAEGDALTYAIVTPPAHGALSAISGNQVTYTPAAGYFGADSFTFRANDGVANSNTAVVQIAVDEAPSLVVSTLADSMANDGVTTLREAIAYARTLSGSPAITIRATGTMTLASELVIDHDMTITGPATISGGGATRVFRIGNATVTLANLTIGDAKSDYGAGLKVENGNVTLNRCIFAANLATNGGGAIYSDGTLALNESTLSNNKAEPYGAYAGGIQISTGTVTITGSTLSGNNGTEGAAILNNAWLTITNSTIAGNTSYGGAGGGIYNQPGGTLLVNSSTIVRNTGVNAGGGIFNYQQGSTTIGNSIVALNTAQSGPDIAGNVTSADYNLFGSAPLNGVAGATSNNIITADPRLDVLKDNGGPTHTIALLPNSPAYENGDNTAAALVTDQRGTGFARQFANRVDIGAFESQHAIDRFPVATVSLSSSAPKTNDTLTATASATDADNDTVTFTYVWKRNGSAVRTTTATSSLTDALDLSAAGAGDRTDVITVEVTPNDSKFDGGVVSAQATVGNTAPLAGRSGSALRLDGVDDYVRLPDNLFPYPSGGVAGSDPISFEAFFKTSTGGVILGQQASEPFVSDNAGWVPAVYVGSNGRLHVVMFQHYADPAVMQSSANVNDGAWHHVAVTYDGTSERFYLDGALQGSRNVPQIGYSPSYTYTLGVGRTTYWPNDNGHWYPFGGILDEVRIWNRARTATEIASSWDKSLGGREAGLLAYYRFDATNGATVLDQTGNGRAGTLTNGAAQETTARATGDFMADAWSSTLRDTAVNGALAAHDVDRDALTFSKVADPAHGSVVVNTDGTFTYTPASGYTGPDSFTFSASDDVESSNVAAFTIQVVAPPNIAPVAAADSMQRYPHRSASIPEATLLANDSDSDGNLPLSITAISAPASGQAAVTRQNGYVFYDPNPDFTGTDTFTYTISDAHGATSTATVSVNIASGTPPPALPSVAIESVVGGRQSRIGFAGVPGRTYRVQYTDRIEPELANWQTLQTVTADAAGAFEIIDPAPLPPQRFYRVVYP